MAHGRVPPSAGDQFEAMLVTLYSVVPEDFIEAREDLVSSAKEEGKPRLAERISHLRRPSHAAFALNVLTRVNPAEVASLVKLGEALRRAQADLSGPRLREAASQCREITAQLTRRACAVATERGVRLGDEAERQIAETLAAALADPDAAEQLLSGRLTSALHPPAMQLFAPGTPAPTARGESAPPTAKAAQPGGPATRSVRERERRRAAADAAKADAAAKAAHQALAASEADERHAEQEVQAVARRVTELVDELDQARAQKRTAEQKLQRARRERTARQHETERADRAAAEAHRRADLPADE